MKCVGRCTYLGYLPFLGKSSASLGKGWVGRPTETNGAAWHTLSHTSAMQFCKLT